MQAATNNPAGREFAFDIILRTRGKELKQVDETARTKYYLMMVFTEQLSTFNPLTPESISTITQLVVDKRLQ